MDKLFDIIISSGLVVFSITIIYNWYKEYKRINLIKFNCWKELNDLTEGVEKHLKNIERDGIFDEKNKILRHENFITPFLNYILDKNPLTGCKPNFFASMVRLKAGLISYQNLHEHIVNMDLHDKLNEEMKRVNNNLYLNRLKDRILIECQVQIFLQNKFNAIKLNRIFNWWFEKQYKKYEKDFENFKKIG